MSNQDDELMFSIGVMESPGTKAKLEAMAKAVEEYQKRFSMGIASVGDAALSVKSSVVSVSDQIKSIGANAASAYQTVTESISELKSVASEPVSVKVDTSSVDELAKKRKYSAEQLNAWEEAETVKRFNEARALEADYLAWKKTHSEEALIAEEKAFIDSAFKRADAAKAAERLAAKQSGGQISQLKSEPIKLEPIDVGDLFAEAEVALDNFRQIAAEEIEVDFGIPKNLKNVFMQFEGVSLKSVDKIGEAMEKKVLDLAKPSSIATAQIRMEYQKRVQDHAKAYAKMAEDMDRAVDRQTSALERQESAVKKSARGMIEGAKGFMQLGLLSKDSSDQIVKGLVAIEGAVNMLEGSIDVMQSFTQGWRAMRQATQASGKVADLSRGMSTLAKAGSAIGVGTTLAGGATAIGGVGSAVGAGSAVGGVGAAGVGAGGLGLGAVGAVALPVAAAAAALASLALVAIELKETFSGTATKAGSVTDTIGSYQVGMLASGMRMTGMFERMDSYGTQLAVSYSQSTDAMLDYIPLIGQTAKGLNLLGDAAKLSASYAAVERSEKLLTKNKLINERRDKIENVERNAAFEIDGNQFRNRVQSIRSSGDVESLATQSQRARFDEQSFQEQMYLSGNISQANMDKDPVKAIQSSISLTKSQASQSLTNATAPIDDKLGAEMQIQMESAKQLAIYQRQATEAAEEQGRTSERYKDSISQVKSIQDTITQSYERQKGLVSERARAEQQSQSQIMEGLQRQLDATRQGIESVKSGYKSAAINFARLGEIEQQQALDAMQQARTKGPASLEDYQKDLLRQTGSKQAIEFADQSDLMEAKSAGFDGGFKSDFDTERLQLESVQKNIEANIQTTYAATVRVDFDSKAIERSVVDQVNAIMAERNSEITLAVQENLANQKRQINDETTFKLKERKANSGSSNGFVR